MTNDLRHIALLLEYDGTQYHGFQVQRNATTVQGELEAALEQLTGEPTRLHGASRTDTGVHARGQVASFRTEAAHLMHTFVAGLNYYLPSDIAVRAACEISHEADVRRHAVSRRYRYTILNQRTPSPLSMRQSYLARETLDVDAMNEAAQVLAGEHDFASFSGPPSYAGQPTWRRALSARVARDGAFVYFEIVAESFLPQQVRRTVAQLLRVGKGKAAPEVIGRFLEQPQLGAAWEAAPPHGLCLEAIAYPAGLAPFTDEEQPAYAPAMVLSGV